MLSGHSRARKGSCGAKWRPSCAGGGGGVRIVGGTGAGIYEDSESDIANDDAGEYLRGCEVDGEGFEDTNGMPEGSYRGRVSSLTM